MDSLQPGVGNNYEEPSSDDEDIAPPSVSVPARTAGRRRLTPHQIQQDSATPTTATPTTVNDSIPTVTSTSSLQREHSISTLSSLPSSIWGSPWVSPRGPYIVLGNIDTLTAEAYDAATDGIDNVGLHLHGADVTRLADITKELIKDAIENNDFTKLLSPDRSFNM
jgi:hypothetical protein